MIKRTVIHKHIVNETNMEIDYDKLAQAIVRANWQAAEKQRVLNKGENETMRATLMIYVNSMVYAMAVFIWSFMAWYVWTSDALKNDAFWVRPMFGAFFAVLALAFLLSLIESFKDTPERATMYFNTNITLLTVVLTLVTLVRGSLI